MVNSIEKFGISSFSIPSLSNCAPSAQTLKIISAAAILGSAAYAACRWIDGELKALEKAVTFEYFDDHLYEYVPGYRPLIEPSQDIHRDPNAQYVKDCCHKAGLLNYSTLPVYVWNEKDSWEPSGGETTVANLNSPVTRLQVANLCILEYLRQLTSGENRSYYTPDFFLGQDINIVHLTDQDARELRAFFGSSDAKCPDSLKEIADLITSDAKILRDQPRFLEAFFDLPLPRNPPTIVEGPDTVSAHCHIPSIVDYPE